MPNIIKESKFSTYKKLIEVHRRTDDRKRHQSHDNSMRDVVDILFIITPTDVGVYPPPRTSAASASMYCSISSSLSRSLTFAKTRDGFTRHAVWGGGEDGAAGRRIALVRCRSQLGSTLGGATLHASVQSMHQQWQRRVCHEIFGLYVIGGGKQYHL